MIFGFVSENLKTQAVAVAFSMAWLEGDVEQRLAAFRGKMYRCFTARGDVAGRADQAGRGCQELAAARRGVQPERLFCHVYCRGKGQAQMIQG